MASIYRLFADALKAEILSLSSTGALPLLRTDEIVIRRFPLNNDGNYYRGLSIIPGNVPDGIGTNEREDSGYPFNLVFWQGGDFSSADNWDVIPQWKESLKRHFNNLRLAVTPPSGCTAINCVVRDGKISQVVNGRRQEISTMVIYCWMRESRI